MTTPSRPSAERKVPIRRRDAAPFRFLDLPPEIRRMVYRLAGFPFSVLSPGHRIGLSIYRPKSGPPRLVQDWFRIPNTPAVVQSPRQQARKERHQRANGASVLYTNKQVSAEAAEMLYSDTRFTFLTVAVLEEFLRTIGSARRHLRHVVIDGCLPNTQETPALNLLKEATRLRSFEIVCDTGKLDASGLARHFHSLVAELQKSYKRLGYQSDALELVKFVHHHGYTASWDEKKEAGCPHCLLAERMEVKVRRLLRILLHG